MADYPSIVIPYYEGTTPYISGSTTPFKYFDNESTFVSFAPTVADYVASNLGFPVHQIEITPNQIYTNLESAMVTYSKIINEFRTKEDFFNLIGQPTGSNYTNRLPHQSNRYLIRLSEAYSAEAKVSTHVSLYTSSVELDTNQSVYNIKQHLMDIHPDEYEFQINMVFHNRIPANRQYLNSNFAFPNGVNAGLIGDNSYYTMYPLGFDLSRMQTVNTHRDMRLSDYSFKLEGDNIRFLPIPKYPMKIWFNYYVGSELSGKFADDKNNAYTQDNLIVNPSDIHYDFLPFSRLNQHAKQWIIDYTLALSMITLGINRRKFGSVNYPTGTISLDGDAFVGDGSTKKDALEQELREMLMKLSKEEGMDIQARILQNQKQLLAAIPLGIYRF